MKVSHLLVTVLGVAVAVGACGRNQNKAPTAAFAVTCSALACTFSDESTDPDGSVASRSWTFGDGATSTAASPSHDYTASALTPFTVELTVTDDDGAQSVMSKTFTVSPPTHLQCGQNPDCTLLIETPAKIEIELTSRECEARGNTLEVLEPVQLKVFTDGCYAPEIGTKITISDNGGAFPAATPIRLQMLSGAGPQVIPPSLIVMGSGGPPWVLRFDDGEVSPADEDITVTIRAVP